MLLMSGITSFLLFLKTLLLGQPQHSTWTSILIWIVRLVTLSFLFRTFLGPYVLQSISGRLKVRSISLRSVRGIYFRGKGGIWRIERIGLSYHRPSSEGASRFSIKVEGLKWEISKLEREVPKKFSQRTSDTRSRLLRTLAQLAPSSVVRRARSTLWFIYSASYSLCEPYVRPVIRAVIVYALRLAIRALPALTQVLVFELDSAVITMIGVSGAELVIRKARLHTSVVLSQLDTSGCTGAKTVPSSQPQHRRFASVANWNTRLTNSLRRTWDRAWGMTEVAASVSLDVEEILGVACSSLLEKLNITDQDALDRYPFLQIPNISLISSARLDPHHGIQPHSLEVFLSFHVITVDMDVLQGLHRRLQAERAKVKPMHRTELGTPLMSPTSALPSRSGWASPVSTNSPFRGVISASMRFRRSVKPQPIRKLPSREANSKLSTLKAIQVNLSRLNIKHRANVKAGCQSQTFNATLSDIRLYGVLSHPDRIPLHREWLGKTSTPGDALTANVYAFGVSVEQTTLDRVGSGTITDHLRIVTLGSFEADAVVSQWPYPWLRGPCFLLGDPNSQMLLTKVALEKVEVTEHFDVIECMLSEQLPQKPRAESHPLLPALLSPVPRFYIGIHVGEVCVRLISASSDINSAPFAVEARTDGFVASAESLFTMLPDHRYTREVATNDHPRLLMHFKAHLALKRTFVNVCVGSNNPLESPGEPIISLDEFHVVGDGDAVGEMVEEDGIAVTIDVPSTIADVQCSTDALSIELWQPDAISALNSVLKCVSHTQKKPPSLSPSYLLDHLPFGLSASFSIARIMVFVTGPDLAPDESLNISRGVASHMGFSAQYCAVTEKHLERVVDSEFDKLRRLELSLPSELVTKACSSVTSTAQETTTALFQFTARDIAFRDALATRLVADDPFGVGDISEDHRSKEYLHIGRVIVDVVLSGHRKHRIPRISSKDDCVVSAYISRIKGSLHLAHAYNLLLAVQTLKSHFPSSNRSHEAPHRPTTLTINTHCAVDKVQLLWEFPLKSRMYMKIKSLTAQTSPDQLVTLAWKSVVFANAIDMEHDGKTHEEWEEIARLMDLRAEIQPDVHPISISVDAESARLRIPFDFVLADLILDINVTLKCIRHLTRMVPSGRFQSPPTPEAEEAKSMPDLTVRIGTLTAEAEDEKIESRLALIWQTGYEASPRRLEREEAFRAKVVTILAAEDDQYSSREPESDFQFTPKHSVSIKEARDRLYQVHSGSWKSRIQQARSHQSHREQVLSRSPAGDDALYGTHDADMVTINHPQPVPPLCRVTFDQLSLHLTGPSFATSGIPDYLYEQGDGMPRDTQYSLLLPMHLNFTVSSARVAYREYPLPLLNVPRHSKDGFPALEFDSDLVIAEEMGTSQSVEWIECAIVKPNIGLHGASPLFVAIPKTLMPVKTYANPIIRVTSDGVTDFGWGVSYGPATQDIMRVLDTLSHAPRDNSPAIGFWDKLRLVFHWCLKVNFAHEVHFHMKGSYDPYELRESGAGLALCWRGNPQLLINLENDQKEVVQVISDTMLVTIPDVEEAFGGALDLVPEAELPHGSSSGQQKFPMPGKSRRFRKVCAKFSSGVRFGVGIALERTCGPECPDCSGKSFKRRCRSFDFRPHYEVMLEKKSQIPAEKSRDDSYNGFRSDFIHLSISLTSSLRKDQSNTFSSIHLSPKLFAHFWAWWSLFDIKSLPIRQGRRYKHKRPLSPKFGQHLATIKYRISVEQLFISHAYMDDSRDAWNDGVTPFVGVKAKIDQFQADMHQRAQESKITTPDGTVKTVVHKPFYAVEVVMKGLELRALLAIFSEPLKQSVPLELSLIGKEYRTRENIPVIEPDSPWIDLDDFVETDWFSDGIPILHLLPAMSCPRFTYFRRSWNKDSISENRVETSKFGNEDTHVCLLGKEASVPQVQIDLATKRINELRESPEHGVHPMAPDNTSQMSATEKMIGLLEDYIQHIQEVDAACLKSGSNGTQSYYMPSDTVSPEEWADFNNVYQVHCPQVFMDNIIRDIMMQYYYCSRARRGVEYHMATRAVKFIRDQAEAAITTYQQAAEKQRGAATNAQAAAMAVRKILIGEADATFSAETSHEPLQDTLDDIDPISGWSEGVSLQKSHFCLLLKPQIVLRSENSNESVAVLTAVQGKLQTYGIMDTANADDPVSGKVMSRNFASLNGLQTFSPSAANKVNDRCVPLEVLVDLKCENSLFDRLVPQTDATFHYDKFNRLRLRNNVTSVARISDRSDPMHNHLHSQTDLIRIHIPRFTVSANDRHFQAISNIVTNLLLYSDAAHKTRSERLEKMLFSYDFTDLASAADVVTNMQARLRHAVGMKQEAGWKLKGFGEAGEIEKLKIEAHILLLAEELDLIFEAIKMAQDKANDGTGQKSALLLHASSSEISWRMLDRRDQLLAKLAVRDIDFRWLNRQDSSTVNNLAAGDLQAFDGAADAEWTEILSKYDEKSNHPLVKKNLFLVADWIVLPPVGGITIYEAFELTLHPMRLQIDTRVGRKIMEYVWPARRNRKKITRKGHGTEHSALVGPPSPTAIGLPRRTSIDGPSTPRKSLDSSLLTASTPPLHKLSASRSFTDLRNTRSDTLEVPRPIQRTRSSDGLFALALSSSSGDEVSRKASDDSRVRMPLSRRDTDDAAEMKTRSSQKTFVWVRVASLHLLLSIMKEDSFLCRDARIQTRDLEYRNQTWSFEELVDQFIPSGRNWKGWVKMAFQQPLVPVLPVARELISKTKWGGSKHHQHHEGPKRKGTQKLLPFMGASRENSTASLALALTETRSQTPVPMYTQENPTAVGLTMEPEDMSDAAPERAKRSRPRVLSLFKRSRSKPRNSVDSDVSVSTTSSWKSVPPLPPRPYVEHEGSTYSNGSAFSTPL